MYIYILYICIQNTLGPRENSRHFAGDIFKCISLKKIVVFWLKFHLLSKFRFAIFQHWFRFGAEQATSHYLNQWWPSLRTHECITWPELINTIDARVRIQYIPRNMHTVLLCFALLWLCNRSWWIHMTYLSIFIRVALLALGQSLDCHSASEVSLMDMGKSVNV